MTRKGIRAKLGALATLLEETPSLTDVNLQYHLDRVVRDRVARFGIELGWHELVKITHGGQESEQHIYGMLGIALDVGVKQVSGGTDNYEIRTDPNSIIVTPGVGWGIVFSYLASPES